jgi:hypothetical protein
VEIGTHRFVVTAGHCLPYLPPCHAAATPSERTYDSLLTKIGAEPTVGAGCVFADPVADLALLCTPDNRGLSEKAEA